jgi:hypothetical protein
MKLPLFTCGLIETQRITGLVFDRKQSPLTQTPAWQHFGFAVMKPLIGLPSFFAMVNHMLCIAWTLAQNSFATDYAARSVNRHILIRIPENIKSFKGQHSESTASSARTQA